MNTMRKIRKNAKALSPVVASIILIAVTVAVSIAVAMWMGALTTGFMQTEQLSITSATFPSGNVTLAISNTGTSSVTIDQIWNGANSIDVTTVTYDGDMAYTTLAANKQGTISFTGTFTSGDNFAFKLVSSKGNAFQYTAIAP